MQTTNTTYRYRLDGSNREAKKKIDCPYCGQKKCFTRYKDYETGDYLDDSVGVCDRSNKCGVHIKPKEWFGSHPETIKAINAERRLIQAIAPKPVHIPSEELKATLNHYEANSFIQSLVNYFPVNKIEKAIANYYLGTTESRLSTDKSKSVVFWFIDRGGNIRAGQVKQFDKDCKTVALDLEDRKIKAFWIHRILTRNHLNKGADLPQWLKDYEGTEKVTCFFGEHLLNKYKNKPVALCEAPKSAIIGSMMYDSFVWLATSSLSYLTKERCKVLQGRKVVLFPDCGIPNKRTGLTCLQQWKDRINEFETLAEFAFSTLLEDNTTTEQKEAGYDIADLILEGLRKRKAQIHITEDQVKAINEPSVSGPEFGNLRLYEVGLNNGSLFEVLADETGEVITAHEKLNEFTAFFHRQLEPGKFLGNDCLLRIIKNLN